MCYRFRMPTSAIIDAIFQIPACRGDALVVPDAYRARLWTALIERLRGHRGACRCIARFPSCTLSFAAGYTDRLRRRGLALHTDQWRLGWREADNMLFTARAALLGAIWHGPEAAHAERVVASTILSEMQTHDTQSWWERELARIMRA